VNLLKNECKKQKRLRRASQRREWGYKGRIDLLQPANKMHQSA
jgi:hypothetical protein